VAKGGLRLPFYLGGTLCTVIALFSLRFFLTVGNEPTLDAAQSEL